MMARIRPAASMPTPSGGPLKSGRLRSACRRRRLERAHGRHQHEDAPEAVDDRRNRGEQLGQKDERLPQPVRAELRDEDRDAERDRRRDRQRENRRIQRAPDERQRAELAGDRIPDLGAPEVEAELLNRQHRLPRSARSRSRTTIRTRTSAKAPVPSRNPKSPVACLPRPACLALADADLSAACYEILIFASAAISSFTTGSGSGA